MTPVPGHRADSVRVQAAGGNSLRNLLGRSEGIEPDPRAGVWVNDQAVTPQSLAQTRQNRRTVTLALRAKHVRWSDHRSVPVWLRRKLGKSPLVV